jgi:hypothetical protein
MEIFIIWLAFSIFAGMVASNKNRSFLGYFMLSIVLSPLIGFVAALIATDKNSHSQKVEFQKSKPKDDSKTSEGANKLQELNSLKEQGFITEEEFEEKRKKIVSEMF